MTRITYLLTLATCTIVLICLSIHLISPPTLSSIQKDSSSSSSSSHRELKTNEQQPLNNKGPKDKNKKRKLQQKQQKKENDEKPLRMLALGGSVTWGASLVNRNNAYPQRLNDRRRFQYTVDNLAIRATGSDYPSHCIESMIGDKTYHVIILEFTLNGTEGLTLLLSRLRRRFPQAIMIYLDVYSLKHEAINPQTRLSPHQAGLDPEQNWAWSGFKIKHDEFTEYLKKIMKNVGGHVLPLPRRYPPIAALDMFSDDWHHLSARGHGIVADEIEGMVKSLKGPVREPRVGDWGEGDQCDSWFASGTTRLNYKNGLLREFSSYKYSMEFGAKGVIVVNNDKPFKIPLYVSFMTRYSVYPMTEVGVNGRKHLINTHIDLPDHIMKTEEVGYADPGRNLIVINPIPGPTVEPFRLTGIILCGVCHGLDAGGKKDDASTANKRLLL